MNEYAEATCRDFDHELFFPRDGQNNDHWPGIDIARQACAACPLTQTCLDDVMSYEGSALSASRYGLFAGLSPVERASLARRKYRKART